ncbi:MAG: SEC-C metal-binding domain-containing protein [Verrucomicrobiales bacterium]
MITPFAPAGEILGPECQVRSIVLADDPRLPDGEYTFVDTYCTDPACDCRKTIIQVMHDDRLVSLVNFGWERPKFYLRWLGPAADRDLAAEMSGLSIDIASPDRVSREGMLVLMNHLLDDRWISMLKDHYRRIRATPIPDNLARLPKVSRNAPCPCGSGKKYKRCCL